MDTMNKMLSPEALALSKPAEEMNLLLMFFSCLMMGILLAYIFEKWAGIRTAATGAIAGAIIVALITLNVDLGHLAMSRMFTQTAYIWVDLIAGAAVGAITGAAVGWWLGFKRPA